MCIITLRSYVHYVGVITLRSYVHDVGVPGTLILLSCCPAGPCKCEQGEATLLSTVGLFVALYWRAVCTCSVTYVVLYVRAIFLPAWCSKQNVLPALTLLATSSGYRCANIMAIRQLMSILYRYVGSVAHDLLTVRCCQYAGFSNAWDRCRVNSWALVHGVASIVYE